MSSNKTSRARALTLLCVGVFSLLLAWMALADVVYVTIAGHIEDTPIYTNCLVYPHYRSNLLAFADFLASRGLACNMQIDYEFLYGTEHCETPAMRAETGGTNVIDYLVSHYGFEIDAHQEGGVEEGLDNYADVRYLGGVLTTAISENVGGLLWDDPAQFARLANGETGRIHTAFQWNPEVLTLAVSHWHHTGDFSQDDVASGVWKPKGANTNFWAHNASEHMVYIGPGEHSDWGGNTELMSTPKYVAHLVAGIQEGSIPTGKMYTVSLPVPQRVIFTTNEYPALAELLDAIEPYVLAGQAQYVSYSEAAALWTTLYGEEPNIYVRPDMPPWYKARFAGKSLRINWLGFADRVYTVEMSTNLNMDTWEATANVISGRYESIATTNLFEDSAAFYRVKSAF
ncbi:MAG: hypothetical protein EOM20_07470 [Spartobacteria bacterium]|nr:hypothetical protein [Spartobacteria bacterium]